MVKRFYVGELVSTELGDGIVVEVCNWRDRIVEYDDDELAAKEFCDLCKWKVGVNFKDDWCEVIVLIDGMNKVFQAGDIKLLNGRDYGEEDDATRYFGTQKKAEKNIRGEQSSAGANLREKKKSKNKDRFRRM